MSNSRPKVDPEAYYLGCQKELEVNAFAGVASALRSQGRLTDEKRKILKQLKNVFNISVERYGAEIRRVANDDFLDRMAVELSDDHYSSRTWKREGQRMIPLLPRAPAETIYWGYANVALLKYYQGKLECSSPRSKIVNDGDELPITESKVPEERNEAATERNANPSGSQSNERRTQTSTASAASTTSNTPITSCTTSSLWSAPTTSAFAHALSNRGESSVTAEPPQPSPAAPKVKEVTITAAADSTWTKKPLRSGQTDDDEVDDSNTNSWQPENENRTSENPRAESPPLVVSTQRSDLSDDEDDHAVMSNIDGDSNSTMVGIPSIASSELVENGVAGSNETVDEDENDGSLQLNLGSPYNNSNALGDQDVGDGEGEGGNSNQRYNDESDSIRFYESDTESLSAVDSSSSDSNNRGAEAEQTVAARANTYLSSNSNQGQTSTARPTSSVPGHEKSGKAIQQKIEQTTPQVSSRNPSISQQQQEEIISTNSNLEEASSTQQDIRQTTPPNVPESDDSPCTSEKQSIPVTVVPIESVSCAVSQSQDSTSSIISMPGTSTSQALGSRLCGATMLSMQDREKLLKAAKVVSAGSGNSKSLIFLQKGGTQTSARAVTLTPANKDLLNKVLAGKNISQTNINPKNVNLQKSGNVLKTCGNVSFRGNQSSVILLDVSREKASSMSIAEILQASGVLGEKKIVRIGTDDATNTVKPNSKITQLSSAATVMLSNTTPTPTPTPNAPEARKTIDIAERIKRFNIAGARSYNFNKTRLEPQASSSREIESKTVIGIGTINEPDTAQTTEVVVDSVFPGTDDTALDESNIEVNMRYLSPGIDEIHLEVHGNENELESETIMTKESKNMDETIPATRTFDRKIDETRPQKRRHSDDMDEESIKVMKLAASIAAEVAHLDGSSQSEVSNYIESIETTSFEENENTDNITITCQCDSPEGTSTASSSEQIDGAE